MDTVRFYNLHPPDEVRIFHTPRQAIRRFDDVAKVYDVRVASGLILRHYSFFHHWFEINCTLSPSSEFVVEEGPIPWCFNCDIVTPSVLVDGDEYNVDLFLDVLVGPDGRRFFAKDKDEFDQAIANGWITGEEQTGARTGWEELLSLIQSGSFLSFLAEICPFNNAFDADIPFAAPMSLARVHDMPILSNLSRDRH